VICLFCECVVISIKFLFFLVLFRDIKPENIMKIIPNHTLASQGLQNDQQAKQQSCFSSASKSLRDHFASLFTSVKPKEQSNANAVEEVENEVRKAFSEVDVDKSGFITFEEFAASRFASGWPIAAARAAFDQMDANKTGTVDFEEWAFGVESKAISIDETSQPQSKIGNDPNQSFKESPMDSSLSGPSIGPANTTRLAAPRMKRLASMATGSIISQVNHGSYKLIDLGSCVGSVETAPETGQDASESLRSVSAIQFQGTPAYSSPENFVDLEKVSYPTDVWSLAATLFHLMSGQLPFEARTALSASVSIAGNMDAPAPDVRDFAPESCRANISSGFAEVLKKGLEKKIENRFQSIDMLSKALHGCLVQKGEEMYTVFISYRVFSEKYHASMLYDALNNTITPAGHRVIVYLDAKRLVKGEGWEEGFSLGLMNSLVALPLISSGVLLPLQALRGEGTDKPDNVCKELLIMQSLLGRAGKLVAIYPILVGPPSMPGHSNYPGTDDFFSANGQLVENLAEVRSPPTMDAALEFLQSRDAAASEISQGFTVKSTVKKILDIQGAKLWVHDDLEEEPITEDSDLWRKVSADPPNPPLDMPTLQKLRAEIRALLPGIYQVIDRAHARMDNATPPTAHRWGEVTTLAVAEHRRRARIEVSNVQLWLSIARVLLVTDRRSARDRIAMLRASVYSTLDAHHAAAEGGGIAGMQPGVSAAAGTDLVFVR
jgi:serine/threonine protein kinase